MATPERRTTPSIESTFLNQAFEFDFHQAVNILETMKPGCVPLGEGDDPRHEAFRMQSEILLSPPSSDIQSLEMTGTQPLLRINFLGLAGIQGPLPMPFTEQLLDRLRHKDTAPADYLNIFNHRLASLWHRMRKKVVLGVAQIEPEKTPAGKAFLDFLGLESKYLRGLLSVSDRILMSYAGLFWQRPRSIIGLERILGHQFDIPVAITQFYGKWRRAPEKDLTKIGMSGRFQVLGKSAVLGARSWEQSSGIVLTTQPLPYEVYREFLETGPRYKVVRDLTYFYMGAGTGLTLKIFINPEHIPPTRLNRLHQLGKTAWLTRGGGKGFTHPPHGMIHVGLDAIYG
jgi:type VI secretion system protein ImpH